MKLRFLRGRFQGRIVDITPAGLTIGRGADNDLTVDEEGISRYHCKIYKLADRWFIEDLGSTNGVRIDGKRIEGARELYGGERIGLSRENLLFSDGSEFIEEEAAEEPGDGAAVAASPTRMTLFNDNAEGEAGPARLPWFRLALLIMALAVLAAAVYTVFVPLPEEGVDAAGASSVRPVNDDSIQEEWSAMPSAPADAGDKAVVSVPATDVETEAADVMSIEQLAEGTRPAGLPESVAAEAKPGLNEGADGIVAGNAAEVVAADVFVDSSPSGAQLILDGQMAGRTPHLLRQVTPGRHRLLLQKRGYEELERVLHVPDGLPYEPYTLRLTPETVHITSKPTGATVYHGSQLLGQTPLLVRNLGIGEHKLAVGAAGHTTEQVDVEVSKLRGTAVHAELQGRTGSIEIVTVPAGCKVFVDGVFKNWTHQDPDPDTDQASAALRLDGFSAGEHTVRMTHPHGTSVQGKIHVEPTEVVRRTVRLWVLDSEVIMHDGSSKYGMLLEKNSDGGVVLAEAPARNDWKRYEAAVIKEIKPLEPARARALLSRLRQSGVLSVQPGAGGGRIEADGR